MSFMQAHDWRGKIEAIIKGYVSSIRKENSLFGRWLEKPSGSSSPSSPSPVDNCIERNTIISENVIVGRGDSSVTVAKDYCVVDFHGKYYSKWFMYKVPSNKLKNDSRFKLKAACRRLMRFKSTKMSNFVTHSTKRGLLAEL